jgi:acyl carrier protein
VERVEIERKLRGIFEALFNIDPPALTADSSPDTIEAWDSLQHLNLVLSIEEEFGVSLADEQVVQMISFGLAVEIVAEAMPDR